MRKIQFILSCALLCSGFFFFFFLEMFLCIKHRYKWSNVDLSPFAGTFVGKHLAVTVISVDDLWSSAESWSYYWSPLKHPIPFTSPSVVDTFSCHGTEPQYVVVFHSVQTTWCLLKLPPPKTVIFFLCNFRGVLEKGDLNEPYRLIKQ